MSSENITRAEAETRSNNLSTHSYEVLVDLSGRYPDTTALAHPDKNFVATTKVIFDATGQPTWIDVIADKVLDAQLNGQPLNTDDYEGSRFPFTPKPGENTLTISALMRYSHTGEGLHRFVDPADSKISLYSQFESADARRMYANFEQPDLKASFQLTLIAPSHWVAISNSITPTPERIDDEFSKWDFAPTPPISTYLTALVCGEYHVSPGTIHSVKGEIPAAVVCRESMAEFLDADRIRQTAQRGFEVYEEKWNREYAFDKYDQIFVPEFNFGAMENVGCVTFRDQYLFRSKVGADRYDARDNTILHELAHMWFGDLVTMKWWNDIWLNESFAEWSAYFCQAEIAKRYGGRNPWVTFANARKAWAYRADQLPTTHPIANDMVDLDAVDANFDGITYAKGASVLKQLVSYVGEDKFIAGVRQYFVDHAYSNTVFNDLLEALENASGRDLSGFTSQWLQTAGVNTLYPQICTNEDDVITSFDIVQTFDEAHPTLRTHTIAIGCYNFDEQGQLVCAQSMPVDVHGESTPIAALVSTKRPDLVLLNDRDLGYVKVRLDPRSQEIALRNIAKMPDPMGRVMVWTALTNSWLDGELPSKTYIDAVLAGLWGEDDDSAIRYLTNQLARAATSFAAPENRQTHRASLVAGFAEHLKKAQPASDIQLCYADALIRSIDSPAGAELLKAWLAGEEVPQGLVIDSDRRWLAINSLARIGAIDIDVIEAELARDNTIQGTQSAAGAKAALNIPAAKADAWRLVMESDLANHTNEEITANFFRYGQEEMLTDYRDKYLDILAQICDPKSVWSSRGATIREQVLRYLWPTPFADDAWIGKVEAFLAEHKLPEQALRTVTENIADQKRANTAQHLDAKNS
uniref:aminopeptidase N n=1 Tax=Vaginimicrobium propionicum TaxID=1871034 RepID=UPI0009714842|nr:aminopeptidase N [Vaginimicrobium propionicum]